ncbi:carotenoid biosynthesis protein [Paenibacillus sp. PK3_47]|uniref:carotenoid biosynthesis protein n=1 Tax=Paenibacillus sp. PK3_47 TaxID=2072642 RepID=UPI00201E0977|nr:carotenoid biosynthesis protein [Paenibacillus sp. PK3_47]UQZ33902.1 carotenoid biosynthesis protein [Paenibacillus sp. PK3_47]
MVRTVFWIWYFIGALLLVLFSIPESLKFSSGLFLVFYAAYAGDLLIKGREYPLMADRSVIYSEELRKPSLWLGFLVIWTGGMAVEWFGVHTGHLFGAYEYSDALGPLLFGVPVTLGFAWIAVVCNAALLSRDFGQSGWRFLVLRALQVGFWTVLLDLVLDPVAHAREFWVWGSNAGGFYGVPWSNFAGWLLIGSLLSLVLPNARISAAAVRRGTRLYQGFVILFGLVGLREDLPLCMVIAGLAAALAEGSLRYAGSREIQKV